MSISRSYRDGLRRFSEPDDMSIWPSLLLTDPAEVRRSAAGLWPEMEKWFGALRDPVLLEHFVRRHLPPGRILLYGAGTHSAAVLDLLRHRPDILIEAVVDRLGERLGTWNGYPVIRPHETPALAFDYVLVGHTMAEWDMVAALLAFGVPQDRILTVYSNPDYRRLSHAEIARRLDGFPSAGEVDTVLVANTIDMVAGERDLERMLGAGRKATLFHGRAKQCLPDVRFPAYDVMGSLDFLTAALRRMRPRAVYVSHNLHCPYAGYAVRRILPDATMVLEAYDYIGIWKDEPLQDLFGLSSAMIGRYRMLEAAAMDAATFHISKRGGGLWSPVIERLGGRYRHLHPRLSKGMVAPFHPGPCLNILYAGWLPSSAILKDFRYGYDFVSLFQEINKIIGARFDIFNNGHQSELEDDIFQDYAREFKGPPITYHRRVGYEELISSFQRYDYGWLCDRKMEIQPDVLVGMPNRLTGYISGGLPAVIDRRWAWCSELVLEHGAGLIVDPADPAVICEALTNADWRRMRSNVLALRDALHRDNDEATNTVACVLSAAK